MTTKSQEKNNEKDSEQNEISEEFNDMISDFAHHFIGFIDYEITFKENYDKAKVYALRDRKESYGNETYLEMVYPFYETKLFYTNREPKKMRVFQVKNHQDKTNHFFEVNNEREVKKIIKNYREIINSYQPLFYNGEYVDKKGYRGIFYPLDKLADYY